MRLPNLCLVRGQQRVRCRRINRGYRCPAANPDTEHELLARPLGAGLPHCAGFHGAQQATHTVRIGDVVIRAGATGTDIYETPLCTLSSARKHMPGHSTAFTTKRLAWLRCRRRELGVV